MAKEKYREPENSAADASDSIDQMLLKALESGDDKLETGRQIVTFKSRRGEEGSQALAARGIRMADAREFTAQMVSSEAMSSAPATYFPEIGAALLSQDTASEYASGLEASITGDSQIESIDPEYFVFAIGDVHEYLRGFVSAAETIARDLKGEMPTPESEEEAAAATSATWGLIACKVSTSSYNGLGIKVAVLDTGMDLGHPDFARRSFTSETFVRQPVQDLHSHGTHCIGTACGSDAPTTTTYRYGIAHRASIFPGKVLSNSGSSVGGSVLAGMNWAIANRCEVISMSLGSRAGVQPYYTAAGQAALDNGLLIVAAAGNDARTAGAPANSPTIMSVASLDRNFAVSSFSNFGKIDIAAPGRDVLSSVPRPRLTGFMSGTSMAAPHVAGCAALWAQSDPSLRGKILWQKLLATARSLAPLPSSRVGAGLVQAPQ